jgi:hypothetical protein
MVQLCEACISICVAMGSEPGHARHHGLQALSSKQVSFSNATPYYTGKAIDSQMKHVQSLK